MPIPPSTGLEARIEDLEIIATGKVDLIEAQRKKLADAYDGMPDKTTPEAKALESRIKTLQDAENSLTAAGDKYLTKEDAGKIYSKKDPNSGRSANDKWAWSRRAGNASATGLNASATGISVGATGVSISIGGLSESAFILSFSQSANKFDTHALQNKVRAISSGLNAVRSDVETAMSDLASVRSDTDALASMVTSLRSVTAALHNNV